MNKFIARTFVVAYGVALIPVAVAAGLFLGAKAAVHCVHLAATIKLEE